MRQNKDMILQYLEEGLVALLPEYGEEGGGTEVLTLGGVHWERRSLPWLVELLARFYRLDLAAVRRHTGRLLKLRHHIPLPLVEGLVLLPVKVRRAGELGEQTAGYVNLLQVERVDAVEDGFIRCRIICGGGVVVPCLNTVSTVRAKLHQGGAARQDLLQRQKVTALPASPFPGLDGATLRELLPSCDCLLRNILLLLLEMSSQPGLESDIKREPAACTGARKD